MTDVTAASLPKKADLMKAAEVNPSRKKLGKALYTWFDLHQRWSAARKASNHELRRRLEGERGAAILALRAEADLAGLSVEKIVEAVMAEYGNR